MNLEWCGDGHWTDMNVKGCNERQLAARILETYLVSQDINVLALVKGSEKYIFLFTDENRGEALRTLGRYASDPELTFTWYDAAVLSQKIRQTAEVEKTHCGVNRLPLSSDPFQSDDIV